jgi:hypothetical protein
MTSKTIAETKDQSGRKLIIASGKISGGVKTVKTAQGVVSVRV